MDEREELTPDQKKILKLEEQLRMVRHELELERRRFAFYIQYGVPIALEEHK